MANNIDGLVLFSGGLDSILAARLLASQGLSLLGLHFTSPFFGEPERIGHWRSIHNLDIREVDISHDITSLLLDWPPNDIGKTLNPCVDCKISMLKSAAGLMDRYGAKFVATGEVLGQRPMSQRKEAMNVILRQTGLAGRLLRPLCAPLLEPTIAESTGLVDRSLLPAITGRGRKEQLELAERLGLTEIPSPGGGCKLTERENARRYWPLIKRRWQASASRDPAALRQDFQLAALGRVLFQQQGPAWVCIGRRKEDNEDIAKASQPDDILLRLPYPGPLALLRASDGSRRTLQEAAAILASYSPRARQEGVPVTVRAFFQNHVESVTIPPTLADGWLLPAWDDVRDSIKTERKKRMAMKEARASQA